MMGKEEVSAAVVNSGDNESKSSFRFKLKRCGLRWVPVVTAWEPCAKKQSKQGLKDVKELEKSFGQKELRKEVLYVEKFNEVSKPNFPPKENVSCFQTSSQNIKKTVSGNQGETNSTCSWSSSTEKDSSSEDNLSNEHGQNAIVDRSCSSQFVLENQSNASLTVVRKINFTCSKKKEETSAVSADNCLTNVEELLSAGILEGARVKYVSTSGNVKLWGIIKDGGYQCSCLICIMSKVLSAHEFELHAGGKSRNPHNHIYLDNGNSLYSIIQELWATPLNILEEVIKRVAGSSVNEEHLWTWRASLHQNNKLARSYDVCYSKFLGMHNISTGPRSYFRSSVRKQQRNTEGCTKKRPRSYFSGSVLEPRKSAVRRTKKRDNNLHRSLFLPGGLRDGTKLSYCVKGKAKLNGYKQGNGVVCSCCNTKMSPSEFEGHAKSNKRQAYRYIRTTNGHTLHEIALQLSNGQCIESIVQSSSDDKCAVCGVGGELIVCVDCSRAHHAVCLGLEGSPTRDWHCSRCTENIFPVGRDSSPVILHPDRVVMPPVYQPGGCAVCRDQNFSVEACDRHKVIQCYQCGKQYHVGCFLDIGSYDLKKPAKDIWFCCSDCKRIHLTMQSHLEENKVLSVNKKLIADGAANSMHCQILSVKSSITKESRLLSKAAALFNECFKTLSSKTYPDLIAAMVRGKNISEWEARQIYCVVLTVDSVVSSVGVLRIISREIAELPVVATSKRYRGKGYFRALFSCIEQLLVSANVKKIVLPAAKDAETMWTSKLGFKKISVEQLSEYTRDFPLTMFSETSMLEKVLEADCESKAVQPTSQLAD